MAHVIGDNDVEDKFHKFDDAVVVLETTLLFFSTICNWI